MKHLLFLGIAFAAFHISHSNTPGTSNFFYCRSLKTVTKEQFIHRRFAFQNRSGSWHMGQLVKNHEVLALCIADFVIAKILCFTYLDCRCFSLKCNVSVSLKLNRGDKASPLVLSKQHGGYIGGGRINCRRNHIQYKNDACCVVRENKSFSSEINRLDGEKTWFQFIIQD